MQPADYSLADEIKGFIQQCCAARHDNLGPETGPSLSASGECLPCGGRGNVSADMRHVDEVQSAGPVPVLGASLQPAAGCRHWLLRRWQAPVVTT